jgi:hypothetical protein
MDPIIFAAFCGLIFVIGFIGNSEEAKNNKKQRTQHIAQFALPPDIFERLRKHHPNLTEQDYLQVCAGLRQFFRTYLDSNFLYVSMPSKVVADLWHEFILYTQDYEAFCNKAFGRFFHHTPAVALHSPANMKKYHWRQFNTPSLKLKAPEGLAKAASERSNEGLRRCWWHACTAEVISPENPARLPLLFELDTKLKIRDGFQYAPEITAQMRTDKFTADFPMGAWALVVLFGTDFSNRHINGSNNDGGGDGGGGSGFGGAVVANKLHHQTTDVACATSVIEAEASVTLAWFLFTGIWNLIVWVSITTSWDNGKIDGYMDILSLVSFPVFGLFLIFDGFSKVLARWRIGNPKLHFTHLPHIGMENFAAQITFVPPLGKQSLWPKSHYTLSLECRCTHVDNNGGESPDEKILWANTKLYPQLPHGTKVIDMLLDLRGNLPPSGKLPERGNEIVWHIILKGFSGEVKFVLPMGAG